MTREQILAAIPHREPFLLLDEVVEWQAERIVCRKRFTGAEDFYRGHYPGDPITPGVLLCEAALQAGAVLLSRLAPTEKPGVPVATRMGDVRFKQMVRPGEAIEIEVTLRERLAQAYFMDAKITCGGKTAARLEFAVTWATQPASA